MVKLQEKERTLLFDEKKVAERIAKVAQAIVSDFDKDEFADLCFIGIQLKGLPFAHRLASEIEKKKGMKIPVGSIDISMYRDDIGMRKKLPEIHVTEIPFDINDKIIILADDVLFTGRTIRAALDAINDYGRPRLIRLAVLLDRGMHEFPIQADYVGDSCKVPRDGKISVSWREFDKTDAVYLLKKGD